MSQHPQSRRAYREHLDEGGDATQQQAIVAYLLEHGPRTRRELAKEVVEVDGQSSVRPRVKELQALGLVEEHGTKENPTTGHEASLLHLALPDIRIKQWLAGEWKPNPPQQRRTAATLRKNLAAQAVTLMAGDGRVWATTAEQQRALEDMRETVARLKDQDGRV